MLRKLFAVAALLVTSVVLASCTLAEGENRHLTPLAYAATSQLANMGSSPQAPMMIRIYKEESTLEVWKQVRTGEFRLFRTYEICTWSGDLGPKFFEGDRQAPEGFYTVTPGQMNPRSSYFLSFDLGFPNRYDRSHGRTGTHLMVHGACSSAGCYAMEDEQIAEIYALAREVFAGGNPSFEVQIFPFRMTPDNLVRHRDNQHFPFWMNLKQGADLFEVARTPPVWDVCGGNYVFSQPNSGVLMANRAGACPPVTASESIVTAFNSRQASDQTAFEHGVASITGAAEREASRTAQLADRSDAINGFFGGLFGGGATPAP